jgi:anti-sigma regulatory factor (Ser/Thr protein kinase)
VRHAYRDGPTGDFELRLRISEDRIDVEVRDTGTWKQPDQSPVPGLGIDLIRSLSTDFSRSTRSDGTLVSFNIPVGSDVTP